MDDDIFFFGICFLQDKRRAPLLAFHLLLALLVKHFFSVPRPNGLPGDLPSCHALASSFLLDPLLLSYALLSRLGEVHSPLGLAAGILWGLFARASTELLLISLPKEIREPKENSGERVEESIGVH